MPNWRFSFLVVGKFHHPFFESLSLYRHWKPFVSEHFANKFKTLSFFLSTQILTFTYRGYIYRNVELLNLTLHYTITRRITMNEAEFYAYHIVTRKKMHIGQIIPFNKNQHNTLYHFFLKENN